MKAGSKLTGLLLCLALVACIDIRFAGPEKEGNSSETVAMVGGQVVDAGGQTVYGASVTLIPHAYNPLSGQNIEPTLTVKTNINGEYFIRKVPKGLYGVEVHHPRDARISFQGAVTVLEETRIPADTLREPGKLRLRIPGYLKQAKGWLFIPHTRYAWALTGAMLEHGIVELDSLPIGVLGVLAYSLEGQIAHPDTLSRSISIRPNGVLELGEFSGWQHTASLSLNTKILGASLNTLITGFPMLLRLNRDNFTFSEAAPDGHDLRFSKLDGMPLVYQIDHWDAEKSEAAVWVALDSVRPNEENQLFKMHWGKMAAEKLSDGLTVFYGRSGYVGTWHLEEEAKGVGAAGLYRNSASSVDHGLDSLTSIDQAGVIGNGHFFHDGEYVRIPSASIALKPRTSLTLSAWIQAKSTDSSGGEIATMGNDYGLRLTPGGNVYLFCYNLPKTDSSNFTLVTTGLNLLDNHWHQIVGTINGSRAEIYVDGQFVVGATLPIEALEYDGGSDFFIGHHGNQETPWDFNGFIDEVRLMPAAASASWLQLSYESQKPGANIFNVSR